MVLLLFTMFVQYGEHGTGYFNPCSEPDMYDSIAYAYTIRHLALSSFSTLTLDNIDFQESRRLVTQLVPFLKDRKSTALYPNLSSITTDIWSRLVSHSFSGTHYPSLQPHL